jgi:hypothetical protein
VAPSNPSSSAGSHRDASLAALVVAALALLTVGGLLVPASWQPLHRWLVTFFSWPAGSIWSNMLAWVLCGGLAFAWTHRVLVRRHREQMAKLEAIHEHLRSTLPR